MDKKSTPPIVPDRREMIGRKGSSNSGGQGNSNVNKSDRPSTSAGGSSNKFSVLILLLLLRLGVMEVMSMLFWQKNMRTCLFVLMN